MNKGDSGAGEDDDVDSNNASSSNEEEIIDDLTHSKPKFSNARYIGQQKIASLLNEEELQAISDLDLNLDLMFHYHWEYY